MGSNLVKSHSFKFLDVDLNRQLIALLKKAKIAYQVSEDGLIRYSSEEEEEIENDLICSVRDRVFPSWQVLTCPPDSIVRYKKYMNQHGILFREELSNEVAWFLIPRKHRPHLWKLDKSLSQNLCCTECNPGTGKM